MRHALTYALALAASSGAAAQEDTSKPPPLHAIQQRKFRMDHEIDVAASLLPLDPFYKGVAAEVAYSYHVNDLVAWEVVRGFWAQAFQTKLKKQLIDDFQYPDTAFEQVRFGISSMLLVKPAYGKYSLGNRRVIHAELFAALGPTFIQTTVAPKFGPAGGVGFRVFVSESISVRFDARYALVFPLNFRGFVNVVSLSLGVGIDFGSAD